MPTLRWSFSKQISMVKAAAGGGVGCWSSLDTSQDSARLPPEGHPQLSWYSCGCFLGVIDVSKRKEMS